MKIVTSLAKGLLFSTFIKQDQELNPFSFYLKSFIVFVEHKLISKSMPENGLKETGSTWSSDQSRFYSVWGKPTCQRWKKIIQTLINEMCRTSICGSASLFFFFLSVQFQTSFCTNYQREQQRLLQYLNKVN